MDQVFRALADPSRRRLLDRLNGRNGQTLRELCRGLDMARQSVSKHLAVLEEANLVTTRRQGREKLHFLNAVPINDIAERWIHSYDRERVRALADLRHALEDKPMETNEFVYTTYIRTTPEQLWRALTEPAFTRRWWHTALDAEWKPGAPLTWTCMIDDSGDGLTIEHAEQRVVEAEPFTRLAYTWHAYTPEFARRVGWDDDVFAQAASEPFSTATFEIEAIDDVCKLTVVHRGFNAGGIIGGMLSEGWPRVLADLKSFLEVSMAEAR
jgi:uncharacterized protein YndB with AHSA1/START domain/DNA-binding transcriptional ArsR family regulator